MIAIEGLIALIVGCCIGVFFLIWLYWNLKLGWRTPLAPPRKVYRGRNPLQNFGRSYSEFITESSDGIPIHGWYIPGEPGYPAFVLCHGQAASKYFSLLRLKFLPHYCPVLLFDYRAHGESGGQTSALLKGHYLDLEAVLRFGTEKLGLEYFILWGRCISTLTVANMAAQRDDVKAVIIEKVMPRLQGSINERLKLATDLPIWFFALGNWIFEWRLSRGCKPLGQLAFQMVGKQVLFLTLELHREESRFATWLMDAWKEAKPQEIRISALHGDTENLALSENPFCKDLMVRLEDMVRLVRSDFRRREERALLNAPHLNQRLESLNSQTKLENS